jgi:hypothetical protein
MAFEIRGRGEVDRIEQHLPDDEQALTSARLAVADILRDAALSGHKAEETLEVFDAHGRSIVRFNCIEAEETPTSHTSTNGRKGTDRQSTTAERARRENARSPLSTAARISAAECARYVAR